MRATVLIFLSMLALPAFAGGGTDLGVDTGFEHAKGDGLPVAGTVHFASGSAVLTAKARAILEPLARRFAADPAHELELAGHTDNSGKEALNTQLSEQRARAVGKYLVDHGVAAARLTVMGYSSFDPIADNRTEGGRSLNRRAEIKISR